MKIETILQILYANKLDHIVSLAVQIDNNIGLKYKVGDVILVQVNRHHLPEGLMFKKDEFWGNVELQIQAINIYSIDEPYMVQLPDGTTEWIGNENIKKSEPTAMVPKEEKTNSLA